MSRSVSSRSSLNRAPMRAMSASISSRTIRCMSRNAASGPSREDEDRDAAPRGSRSAPSAARASRSGRAASSAAVAARCSSRNRWIRARASGGTCGDSIAALSAAIMSSLRRLAIWITRARSTWRSSIGGRASARTTAEASLGSASSRVQATTSRDLRPLHVHGGLGRHLRRRPRSGADWCWASAGGAWAARWRCGRRGAGRRGQILIWRRLHAPRICR